MKLFDNFNLLLYFKTSYDVATNVLSFLYFKLALRKYFFTEKTRPLLEIYNKRTRRE